MASLTSARWAPEFSIRNKMFPLAGFATAYRGGMAAADTSSGCVRPATSNTATLINIGQFMADVNNSATSATTLVNVQLTREIFVSWYDNATGANAIVAGTLFSNCYMQDDHTVTLSTGVGSAVAGRVWGIDASLGVLVQPIFLY
jgi:hypothetical protein